ncbi:MAG TPA: chitobiase/beta-hexosaminidase C-terminal domain-containing protein, partial [Candidatus Dormibacteraeota bacterium]|nr:chitobiase/beta-hexosaminidase C-terminal domain-containing protein [Candidatus Dormibacteraeota bacterium]
MRSRPFPRLLPKIAAHWLCYWLGVGLVCGQMNVLTHRYDAARTGLNTNETILTLANINTNTFGKLFSYPVDGQVYGQPLCVSGVNIPGQGTHNVVFITTQHNSVYAFDADNNGGTNGGVLWQTNLGPSAVTPNSDFANRYGPYHDINPEVGITGTPVIDLASGTLYVDAFTHEGTSYLHRVHALNITNGTEQPYGPVVVSFSMAGTGVGSSAGVLPFSPIQHLQRAGLTLAGGMLYVTYTGYADTDPYHGWILGFKKNNLLLLTNYVFNTTPNSTVAAYGANAGEGGIWMAGNGLCVDDQTNLFFMTGNGVFNATNSGGTEYGDCFLRLSTSNGLAAVDYFSPFNQATLAANDTDLGSGGAILLPDSVGSLAHPHLMLGAGKEGKIYLLDRDNLGRFNSNADTQIVQSVAGQLHNSFCTPAYFNQQIYYQCIGDTLKAFAITNGVLSTTPISQTANTIGFPGASPVVSASGTNNGIVWVLQNDTASSGGPAVLHAYNATNLALELYNSSQAGIRDRAAAAVKTTIPTVANGKVYVGGRFGVSVFGNGSFVSVPTISPNGGFFTNSITVTISDSTPGATLYYTVDNSTPTTNSLVYSAPFLLTNTAAVKVFGAKPGLVSSPMVAATFINSASNLFSPGFLRQEFYSGALRTDLENPSYTNSPVFVQYVTNFETPTGQGSSYAERVSGYFIPPQTTNYVFFIAGDDDSDLFLSTDDSPSNKHLIAQETAWSNSREWLSSGGGSVVASKRSDQFTGTTWPGGNTIALNGGSRYYIEAIHHQGSGGDALAATFIVAGTPDPVNGDAPKLTGSAIAAYAYNNTFLLVTDVPQDAVTVEGRTASFSVSATAGYLGTSSSQSPPIIYQWQAAAAGSSLFANIPNANASLYTTPPLTLADSGSEFLAALATGGAATNTPGALLTVVHDGTPPVPVQVTAVSGSGRTVTVSFSEPLQVASAQNLANYLFSPGNIAPTNVV